MRVLVTGAAGFIGSQVAARFSRDGNTVIGVDNFTSYYPADLKRLRVQELLTPLGISVKELNLDNFDDVESLFDEYNPEVVVHLAAQPGVRLSGREMHNYVTNNLLAFGNVLLASTNRNVEAFIYASSSSVYGDQAVMPFKESGMFLVPNSFYGATKLANEVLASSLAGKFQTRIRALRFFTVYGPYGRPDMAYFRIATSLLTDSKFELFGDGSIRRDFTYINDAIDCVSLLVNQLLTENPGFSDIVNLGGGKPASMLDLIGVSESISGKKLRYSISSPNSSDVSMTYSDSSYLRQLIGRAPSTTVEDGMTQVINWCLRPDTRERLQNWIIGTL